MAWLIGDETGARKLSSGQTVSFLLEEIGIVNMGFRAVLILSEF